MNPAAPIGRDVQIETGTATDRFVVDVEQLLGCLDASVFLGVIKPTGTDRDIAFGGKPIGAGTFARVESVAGAAGIAALGVKCGPARIARDAFFVADPAEIRSTIAEHYSIGHQFADDLPGILPVVIGAIVDSARFSGPAIKAVATIGAVEPDGENIAVTRQQLAQLVAVISDVFRPAIIFVVAVPGRKINAELQSLPTASGGNLFHHVAFAAAPRAVLHGMLGVSAGPKTEPIVVLGGQDQIPEPGLPRDMRPLTRIQLARIKQPGSFRAVAPLPVRECVHAEMQETVELHFVPAKLPSRRHRTERLRRCNGMRGGRINH